MLTGVTITTMSLTSLLKNNAELRNLVPNLKDQLVTLSGSPVTREMWNNPISVPSIGISFEAGRIGTAFDYVARALLERQVGTGNVSSQSLVAEQGLSILLQAIGGSAAFEQRWHEVSEEQPQFPNFGNGMNSTVMLITQQRGGGFVQDPAIAAERAKGFALAKELDADILEILAGYWGDAVETKAKFLIGEASIEDYSRCAIFLAELDGVYRAASVSVLDYCFRDMKIGRAQEGKTYFSQHNTLSIDELSANVAALGKNFEQFAKSTKMTHVELNPTFEHFSTAVGGADADFIYDATLIDLKSSSKMAYVGVDWAQLLGYAAMKHGLGGNLEQAGMYFARFNCAAIIRFTPALKSFLGDYLQAILATAKSAR